MPAVFTVAKGDALDPAHKGSQLSTSFLMLRSHGSHPNLGRSGMLPTPKASRMTPLMLRSASLP